LINKYNFFAALPFLAGGAFYLELKVSEIYPPKEPKNLPPLPGHKVIGYMGTSYSKIEAIRRMERNLFFCETYPTPQQYALSRTSFLQRVKGDRPTVLQIEIPIEKELIQEKLWRDPYLSKSMPSLVPVEVSLYPAIPPSLQKELELKVREHHTVSCENKIRMGGLCRATHQLYIDFKNKFTKNF
jgi:hypothetical protein